MRSKPEYGPETRWIFGRGSGPRRWIPKIWILQCTVCNQVPIGGEGYLHEVCWAAPGPFPVELDPSVTGGRLPCYKGCRKIPDFDRRPTVHVPAPNLSHFPEKVTLSGRELPSGHDTTITGLREPARGGPCCINCVRKLHDLREEAARDR